MSCEQKKEYYVEFRKLSYPNYLVTAATEEEAVSLAWKALDLDGHNAKYCEINCIEEHDEIDEER